MVRKKSDATEPDPLDTGPQDPPRETDSQGIDPSGVSLDKPTGPSTESERATSVPEAGQMPEMQSGTRAGPEPETQPDSQPVPDLTSDPIAEPDPHGDRTAGSTGEPAAGPVTAAQKRSSVAGRALAALVLVLVGAVIGIWAAPRIAPVLPAGMAPVAAWLSPGQSEAAARIAEIGARLDTVVAEVAEAPDAGSVEATAREIVSAAESSLSSEIAAVRDSLSEADVSEVSARVGRLETSLDGALAEFSTLKEQIGAGVTDNGDPLIDTYRAELDGLRAEVGRLSSEVSGLGGRLDEVEADAEADVAAAEEEAAAAEETAAAAQDQAALRTAVAQISAAVTSGAPFAEPLADLAASDRVDVPSGLSTAAETGVPTLAQLRASFGDAAHRAIRASITASAGEGFFARSAAFLEAQVASRSLEPQDGATPDAILSRVEAALRQDDLRAAIAEAEALPSEGGSALSDWLAAAKLRAEAEAGLVELSDSVSTQN